MWGTKLVVLLMKFGVPDSQQDLLALLAHINMHKRCSPSHSYCKTYLLDSLKMIDLVGFIRAKFPHPRNIKNFYCQPKG